MTGLCTRLLLAGGLFAIGSIVEAAAPVLYAERCAQCHTSGEAGAPKIGDRREWSARMRPGMTFLYRSALEGIPNTVMVPKGGHRDLADDDVRAIVDFMIAAAGLPADVVQGAARYEALGITNRDFIRLDANYDGFLTPAELASDPEILANLARFDENKDGRLGEAEYLRLEAALERERAAVAVDDATLVKTIRDALATVKGVAADRVKIESVAGVVTLSAVVENADAARQAYAAIRRIKGIRSIDNRLVPGEFLSFD